jgi:hypothetical protein
MNDPMFKLYALPAAAGRQYDVFETYGYNVAYFTTQIKLGFGGRKSSTSKATGHIRRNDNYVTRPSRGLLEQHKDTSDKDSLRKAELFSIILDLVVHRIDIFRFLTKFI